LFVCLFVCMSANTYSSFVQQDMKRFSTQMTVY